MTDYISAVAGATVDPTGYGRSADVGSAAMLGTYGLDTAPAPNELDRDAFLKLLVAQLRYQDPLNPSDPSDFIATTAQFSTLEELQKISAQSMASTFNSNLTTAGSLIGRQIAVMGEDGNLIATTVHRALVVSGEVLLMTDLGQIPVSRVVEVGH